MSTLWSLYLGQVVSALLVYTVALYVYRIYFSKLSNIPGPKLAAATGFYEAYYDLVKDGRYPWKIQEMHKKYGPVVRVNPREVHIEDSEFVDKLYLPRHDRDPLGSKSLGVPLSTFGSWQSNLHRPRRAAVSKFFSKASIASRAPVIQEKVLKMCERLIPYAKNGEVVSIDAAYTCLTLDIISQYCFGVSCDSLEISIERTDKGAISYNETVFDQMLDSKLPSADKAIERLVQEGHTFVSAGTETTSRALSISTVHLLKRPHLLARLREELLTVMPDIDSTPTLNQLERLPFLTAVIKESIRLGGSTAFRGSRLTGSPFPITYKDWQFPPGTPVSMTLYSVLSDPNIFYGPEDFNPMRWLISEKSAAGSEDLKPNTDLDRYFVSFSRGPRNCLGMWLAWAELYITMAHVYRKLELELYDTDIVDVAAYRERLACFPKDGSQGIRSKFRDAAEVKHRAQIFSALALLQVISPDSYTDDRGWWSL
ncbi:MAG: hypothetical protein Q9162_003170 [Coniocarpon cinnabarinum]